MNIKVIKTLVKDISNRTGVVNKKDLWYMELCLKIAYAQGKVDSNKEWNKIQKKFS